MSHPAAVHTLQGASDVAPGSPVTSPNGLRSAAAGLPDPNWPGRRFQTTQPVEMWTTCAG